MQPASVNYQNKISKISHSQIKQTKSVKSVNYTTCQVTIQCITGIAATSSVHAWQDGAQMSHALNMTALMLAQYPTGHFNWCLSAILLKQTLTSRRYFGHFFFAQLCSVGPGDEKETSIECSRALCQSCLVSASNVPPGCLLLSASNGHGEKSNKIIKKYFMYSANALSCDLRPPAWSSLA